MVLKLSIIHQILASFKRNWSNLFQTLPKILSIEFIREYRDNTYGVCTIFKEFYRELEARPTRSFAPLRPCQLTEQDITDFVICVKEYAFMCMFNKNHVEEAAEACQHLSILRPELIVPSIVEKFDILALFFVISLNFVDTSHLLTT
jgi:hypothetical protein